MKSVSKKPALWVPLMPGGSPLTEKEASRRAKKIRLLAMDVDGVLTDGSITILESGEEIKSWNVKDRIGFFMVKHVPRPLILAWITGRSSTQVHQRATDIGIQALRMRCADKGEALTQIAQEQGLSLDQTLFIGDDLVDLPAFDRAALAVCPSDAHPVMQARAHLMTSAAGGRGVFRQVLDWILAEQDMLETAVSHYTHPKSPPTT